MTDDNPSPPVERATWTDADFDSMGWHDAALHAVAIEPSPPHPGRLLFDIDYIVGWIAPTAPATTYEFWMCPATLVFDAASDLVGDVSLVDRAFAPSFDAISRTEPDAHGLRTWNLAGHEFTMQFRAARYTQYLRTPPMLSDNAQRLSVEQRGGISFAERGFG